VKSSDKRRCFEKVDPESRDDAADYEAETRVVRFPDETFRAEKRAQDEAAAAIAAQAAAEAAVAAALAAKEKAKMDRGRRDSNFSAGGESVVSVSQEGLPLVDTEDADGPGGKKNKKSPGSEGEMILGGYVYDIGAATCKMLKTVIASTDLLVIWGTVGACEMSAFQTGQKVVVSAASKSRPLSAAEIAEREAAAVAATTAAAAATAAAATEKKQPQGKDKKPSKDKQVEDQPMVVKTATGPGIDQIKESAYTILMGESTVEWFTRMLDQDGEAGGDLVGTGRVACTSRDSSLFAGLLGLYSSPVLNGNLLRKREPFDASGHGVEDEWVYNKIKEIRDDDEDEDDDDDDDEDS
jgi:uncharacterized protein (DUF2147 family)